MTLMTLTPLNHDLPRFEGPRRNWYQRRMRLPAYLPTGGSSGRPPVQARKMKQLLNKNKSLTLAEAISCGISARSYYRLRKWYFSKLAEKLRTTKPLTFG